MIAETPHRDDDEARRDETATERVPDDERGRDQSGGPLGNPSVDEESLRKHQEESSERSD
jgi:hypothetical protein